MALFEDTFRVKQLNPDGKKFDRVNRLSARSDSYEMDLLLDINCDIYSVQQDDVLSLKLASTLDLTGAPDDGTFQMLTPGRRTLADDYDYVMHGRVYKYEHVEGTKVAVYVSYGGLLMKLSGEQSVLVNIEIDSRVYLLLKHC